MIEEALKSFSQFPKDVNTFIIAMLPVFELRGAIPYALSSGISIQRALIISILGNLVPVVPVLFFLEPVSNFLRRFWIFKKFFNWLFERTRRRSHLVERFETIGLILFVAIPLPVTGAWTGCVAASLFKIRLRYAFLAIATGVCIAGLIVTVVWSLGAGIFYNVFISHS